MTHIFHTRYRFITEIEDPGYETAIEKNRQTD